MDSSVSPKDEIWFLRVCHHVSNAVYIISTRVRCYFRSAAVKVTALLKLPAAGISVSPRLAAADYAALLGERHCEQSRRLHVRL
jgi:hypothetical protein